MLSAVLQLIRKSYQLESNLEADTLYRTFIDNKQSFCLRLRNHGSEENRWRSGDSKSQGREDRKPKPVYNPFRQNFNICLLL